MKATRGADVIRLRVSRATKARLSQAAAQRGQSLSGFVVESAWSAAQDAILDQRVFVLEADAHAEFLRLLDAPPQMSPAARARLNRKALWDG